MPLAKLLSALRRRLTPELRASAAPSAGAQDTPDVVPLTAAVAFCDLTCADGQPAKRPTFTINAYTGVPMPSVFGFYAPVIIDLAGLKAAKAKTPVLLEHDPEQIVGQGEAKISARDVQITGVVTNDDAPGRTVVNNAKNGFEWQASVGASIVRREFLEAGKTATVNGQVVTGPMIIAREAILREVSFCALGADGQTSASVAASTKGTIMNFEQWLQAKGWDPAKLSTDLKAHLKAVYDDEMKAAAAAAPSTTPAAAPAAPAAGGTTVQASGSVPVAQSIDLLAQMRSEQVRITKINQLCGTKHADLAAAAIADGRSADAVELEVLRASRSQGPAIHVVHQAPGSLQILEAALCLSQPTIGEQTVLKAYGEKTANDADRFRRLGLRRTLEVAASMCGVQLPMTVDSQWIRAAFSSSELSGLVGAVANKALQATMAAMDPVAPRVSRAASHANFHTHTVYSLAVNGELQKVAPDGELKHLSLSEESYTRKIDTRGAILRLTRTDIVNDDLGAFNDNARAIVRKAFMTREKAFFTLVNATGNGASHFTAARGNYFEGAATNLSITSLTTAVKMFREMKGKDNEPTMIVPKILLVPPALEETAKALMDRSAQLIAVALGSTAAKSKEPNANVWAGTLTVEVAQYLSTVFGLSGASDTAWYLLGDPNDVPCFEIAYLNGQQQPIVDFFGIDTDPTTLGATWRIYWDFGVAAAEYRAGTKSKGAA